MEGKEIKPYYAVCTHTHTLDVDLELIAAEDKTEAFKIAVAMMEEGWKVKEVRRLYPEDFEMAHWPHAFKKTEIRGGQCGDQIDQG